jgi:hypothetical protein
MESREFEELSERSGALLEGKMTTLARKLEARMVVEREIEAMKAEGKAHEITEEEIRMIRAFRSFKTRCKAGDVFKWQTRPVEGVTIHQDTSLIQDPQDRS